MKFFVPLIVRIGRGALLLVAAAFFVGNLWLASSTGQTRPMPDGPGKAETQKLCAQCHEMDRSIAPRQDRAGWQRTVDKMIAFGMKATDKELEAVMNYLVAHFPADEVPKIKVNEAEAIEFESGLSLKRSQAAAIIRYRDANGPFKTIDDLKKVPGLDPALLDAKKDRLSFQ